MVDDTIMFVNKEWEGVVRGKYRVLSRGIRTLLSSLLSLSFSPLFHMFCMIYVLSHSLSSNTIILWALSLLSVNHPKLPSDNQTKDTQDGHKDTMTIKAACFPTFHNIIQLNNKNPSNTPNYPPLRLLIFKMMKGSIALAFAMIASLLMTRGRCPFPPFSFLFDQIYTT